MVARFEGTWGGIVAVGVPIARQSRSPGKDHPGVAGICGGGGQDGEAEGAHLMCLVLSGLLPLLLSSSAMASTPPTTANAGEFANLATTTDGQTPSVLSTWSDMQRSAPTPAGASSVSPSGKVTHGVGLPLPPGLVSPSLGLSYQQGGSAHSYVGRGWAMNAGLTVRRPTGKERLAWFAARGEDVGNDAVDVLVVSGDGLDGAFYETANGWEWESTTPSTAALAVQSDGDVVVRAGRRRWELAEVVPNVFRTTRTDDRSGNRADYTWEQNKLLRIDYGGHGTGATVSNHVVRVELEYQDAAHASYSSASGALEVIDERLVAVHVQTRLPGGTPEERYLYVLTYNSADATYADDELLLEVRQEAPSGESRLLQRFDYSDLSIDTSAFEQDTQPRWIGQSTTARAGDDKSGVRSEKIRFEDWSHDGLPDVVDGYVDGGVTVHPLVRSWASGAVDAITYYNLPSLNTPPPVPPPGYGMLPDVAWPRGNGLDVTLVRVFESWNWGTTWGKNATFTTETFVDVDQDGWLDRIRALDTTILEGELVPPVDAMPLGAPPEGFLWEVCYGQEGGEGAGNSRWDFDCNEVRSPFVAPRIGFAEVAPFAASWSADYTSTDQALELVDLDHDGWLDLVFHDGAQVKLYRKAGSAETPVSRRSSGWELSNPTFAGSLDWLDGDRGFRRALNRIDAESYEFEADAHSVVATVYSSEEVASLRDINGDGRMDRVVVRADFDTTGLWNVYFADGEGFDSIPIPWAAPRPYLGRSDEGKPYATVTSVPFCAGDFPMGVGGPDGSKLGEVINLDSPLPEWDPGDLADDDGCFMWHGCLGTYYDPMGDHPCTYEDVMSVGWEEVCYPHAYVPGMDDLSDLLAQMNDYSIEQQQWRSGDFDQIIPGRPRVVFAGMVDLDADGRPDFFDGEAGVWHRNLGDGFDPIGTLLPMWWPVREVRADPLQVQYVHVLDVSLTQQYVLSAGHCVDTGNTDPEQVVGGSSFTDTKLRVLDANGDGLLDIVANPDFSRTGDLPGITYAGGYAPQEPPGLLKRVTSGTLLDVDFQYMSSVEVYPNGHAEQTTPVMGTSLGAEPLVSKMSVSDPFQPNGYISGPPGGRPPGIAWDRIYTYSDPICREGRCIGFQSVLMEDLTEQREPGGNTGIDGLRSYTDSTYIDRGDVFGLLPQHVYVGEGEVGFDDRYHTYTVYDDGTALRRTSWPTRLEADETRRFPEPGLPTTHSTTRYTEVEHTLDDHGNVLLVDFRLVDA